MDTIFKYEVPMQSHFTLSLPVKARIIRVAEQQAGYFDDGSGEWKEGMRSFLWAIVDTLNEHRERHFRIFGTGHNIPNLPDLEYIGTWDTEDGFVWHLFEKAW